MNESKKEYPYTGKDKENQIVLFTGEREGIVIESKFSRNKVNVLYHGWFEEGFIDITEEYLADKKIKILSPLHSEYVQKLAFKYGYGWQQGVTKVVRNIESKFLFFYKDDKDITHSENTRTFDHKPSQEITIPLPEDYVSEEDDISLEESDVEEFKVGDQVVVKYNCSFHEVCYAGKLLYLSDNHIIIEDEYDDEVHLERESYTVCKPKTEEEKLKDELCEELFQYSGVRSRDGGREVAKALTDLLLSRYSITKKPR